MQFHLCLGQVAADQAQSPQERTPSLRPQQPGQATGGDLGDPSSASLAQSLALPPALDLKVCIAYVPFCHGGP